MPADELILTHCKLLILDELTLTVTEEPVPVMLRLKLLFQVNPAGALATVKVLEEP